MSAMTGEQSEQISIDFSTKPNLNLVSKHPDAESFNNFHIDFIFLNIIFCFIDKMSRKFFILFSKRFELMFKVSSYQPRGCITASQRNIFPFITEYYVLN